MLPFSRRQFQAHEDPRPKTTSMDGSCNWKRKRVPDYVNRSVILAQREAKAGHERSLKDKFKGSVWRRGWDSPPDTKIPITCHKALRNLRDFDTANDTEHDTRSQGPSFTTQKGCLLIPITLLRWRIALWVFQRVCLGKQFHFAKIGAQHIHTVLGFEHRQPLGGPIDHPLVFGCR